MKRSKSAASKFQRRRGAVYIAVLMTAVIVSVIGFAGVHLSRIQLRTVEIDDELQRAKLLARTAVEQGASVLNHTNGWRNSYTSGVETTPINFGGGQISYKYVDDDGNLLDDPTDAVWIYGYGRVGNAIWVERAYARIDGGKPLECLRTVFHCSGTLTIGTTNFKAINAPASTDGQLTNNGSIDGDVEAVTKTGSGSVTGTETVPADKKGMPLRTLFDDYKNRATHLTHSTNLSNLLLAPTVNGYDFSGTNPDGVYYINTNNANITIDRLRLVGTLVIDAGTGTVTIDKILAEPHRKDYPVLLIKGNVTTNQWSNVISELIGGVNLNPPGVPYNGNENGTNYDVYPNKICGLVHIQGNLNATDMNTNFKGVLIVDGNATFNDRSHLTHDPALMENPPLGYTEDPTSINMIISSGSWSRQTAP